MRNLRLVGAFGALFVVTIVLAACGGVPGNSVATVGDEQITKSSFEHWLDVAAKGNAQTPGAATTVPDAPDFEKCVAERRKAAPKPGKAQPKVRDEQLRQQCEDTYDQLRDQAMNFLIQAEWVQGEAADEGIEVSDQRVRREFDRTKQQAFPKEADFKKFLTQSGMTEEDVLLRVRIDTLANELRKKATKQGGKVTEADVRRYYDKNKNQFATPESRDVRLVLTRSRARAEEAKRALESGRSWRSVAREYSVDEQTKSAGGLLPGVAKGQQDQALEKAAFAARKGQLAGPLRAAFGFYVLEVEKITPRRQESLKDSQVAIRQQLIAQRQDKALKTFIDDFRKKWTGETECREEFAVEGCENAPKRKKQPQAPVPTPQPAPQGG